MVSWLSFAKEVYNEVNLRSIICSDELVDFLEIAWRLFGKREWTGVVMPPDFATNAKPAANGSKHTRTDGVFMVGKRQKRRDEACCLPKESSLYDKDIAYEIGWNLITSTSFLLCAVVTVWHQSTARTALALVDKWLRKSDVTTQHQTKLTRQSSWGIRTVVRWFTR